MVSDYDWYTKANLSKFSGEWVAILDKKVKDHKKNVKKLNDLMKKEYPEREVLIVKIPKKLLKIRCN